MPLARHKYIFSSRLPAGELEQGLTERAQALTGPGRNMNVPTFRVLLRPRRITGKIDLVEHRNRPQFPRQPVDDEPVGCSNTGTGVDDEK